MYKQILLFIILNFAFTPLFSQKSSEFILGISYGGYCQTKQSSDYEYWGNTFSGFCGVKKKQQSLFLKYQVTRVYSRLFVLEIEDRMEFAALYGMALMKESKLNLSLFGGVSYGWGTYEKTNIRDLEYNFAMPQIEVKLSYNFLSVDFFTSIEFAYYYLLKERASFNPIVFYPQFGIQILL